MRAIFVRIYAGYACVLYYTAVIAGAATFVIMWLIDSSALSRKIFNWPVPGSVEITESLMVLGVLLPMAYAQHTRAHVRVPLLTDHLPARLQTLLFAIAMLVGVAFFAVMAWSAYNFTMQSYMVNEHVWGAKVRFPLYPVKAVMFVGWLLLTVQFLLDFVKICLFGPDDIVEADERVERGARGQSGHE